MICLIVANVIAIVLESVPSLHQVYQNFFFYFEVFSVAIFTVEYILRVWSCTAVIATQRRALTAALLIMGTALMFTSSILYLCEHEAQPDTFGSIPEAMWWSIATLTTVGYGDAIPITVMGRIFGALTMVMGIGMLALPTGVIATGFANEIKKHDFVISWLWSRRWVNFSGRLVS